MTPAKNIFLLDDDDTFVFLTKETIFETGIPVNIKEFSEGSVVLEHLKKYQTVADQLPDVIFLDLHLHIMNGWQFLDELSSLKLTPVKQAKLYILSSSISPYDIERARNYPMVDEFIIKPILQEKFASIIKGIE